MDRRFQGWWWTVDRRRFEPLTVRDAFSRFVLCAQALENNRTQTVRVAFERLFTQYGLPEVIRSDNGSPSAAYRSPLGLTRRAIHQAERRLNPSGER